MQHVFNPRYHIVIDVKNEAQLHDILFTKIMYQRKHSEEMQLLFFKPIQLKYFGYTIP